MRFGRVLFLLLVLFVTRGSVWGQQSNAQASPSPKAAEEETLELNTTLMRSTFKLIGDGSIGTAFILGRPSQKDPTRAYFVLVTAAHVLEQSSGSKATLVMRTKNTDTYVRALWPIAIREKGKPLWTKHPEADVAVMYVTLPREADLPVLPTQLLATDDILNELQVHPGDSLSCLGFPNGVEANDSGFPVLRSGKIASYPIFPTRTVKSFLFDINVFDGNSGGPVYLAENMRWLAPRSMRVGGTQFIVGLVSEQLFAGNELASGSRSKESLRLAIVIHASLIREAIDLLPILG
jgi:hypothetical protein